MPSGSCLCGKIAFSFLDFHITQGTPKKFVRKGISGLDQRLFFCGDCGTNLFVQPESMEGTTLVRAGSLGDSASDFPIKVEFFTKDRRSYNTPVQDAQQNIANT
ncbi:hypothetical protein CMQ_3990 [Grosmannia clavigera kw1407]|uniref:CENP-V/GFA domain-containing protein n=1 Tax=Grosmannia clavigera (strain kw1407 / UAMH 11150) TaxID=655863 RepID=F0X8P3_GROCL|nr:uncharacterized protein CMQ_3990 [Grosmannia clavigera kw1407]EFX05921.1 hypothetical protein CMQ_3990 [Grosmannia clavigera kw1407]